MADVAHIEVGAGVEIDVADRGGALRV